MGDPSLVDYRISSVIRQRFFPLPKQSQKSRKGETRLYGKISKDRFSYFVVGGGPVGAKVLGKRSVPGRPTYLDKRREKVHCACNRCGSGLFGFFSRLSFLLSFSLSGRRSDID